MAMKQLYINGTGTGDYGIYISSDTYLNAPAPDYVAHQIPGRNGDLLQFNSRLNNIARKFTCYIPDNAQANMDGFKKLLYSSMGYLEISSDYEPDTYQRGYLADEIEAEPFLKDDVLRITFDLIFSCEPQKYFKDNSPETKAWSPNARQLMYLLPRSHRIVQQVFKNIPQSEIPAGDAFLLMAGLTFYGWSRPVTFGDLHFEMPGYNGFVAAFWMTNITFPDSSDSNVIEVAGYSNFGTIDDSAYTITITDTSTAPLLMFMLPFNVVGTATMRITNQTSGTTSLKTEYPAAFFDIDETTAVGGHYTLTITGVYSIKPPAEGDKTNTMVLVGSLNGSQTFQSLINIDASVFRPLAASEDVDYPYSISIDSDNLTVTATFNNNDITMNEYIQILGDMDGISDKVELYVYNAYRYTHETATPLIYRSFSFTPRWWKI